jgi:hypothetical protein
VPNVSAGGWPYEQFTGRHDPDRDRKNKSNAATYFSIHKANRVLHIAAGDNPLPDSLAEDVEQYNNKNYPQLLAVPGGPISQYLPAGELFDKVVVVNIKLAGKNPDYGQTFQLAAAAMKPGATIVWAAVDGNHDSILWAIGHETDIAGFGFTKVSPAAGLNEAATPDIRALPGSAWRPGVGMVAYSNANAVQVVWRKN